MVFICIILFFFRPFILQGKLPIPSDTIIGLYHPFLDLYAKDNPRGIQFKNFLITDPVRQQYPWRELAISIEKTLHVSLWNPYNAAGAPLVGNFQSAVFYPLNFLFFLLPFSLGWSLLIVIQPLLGGLFLYYYLVHMRLSKWASILGAITFSFSGFSIAWLEWNTIGHVAMWLPLILLSIDKILRFYSSNESRRGGTSREVLCWSSIFLFSLISSFFAGHLQTFFYLFIVSLCYLFARWVQNGKDKKIIFLFSIYYSLFFLITSIQWIPTLLFILESARNVDQVHNWQKDGWFIPWQHIIQFIAPDFFGNPATLNYWGVWNYGEFIGYIGIFPLIAAVLCLFFRRDKKTLFFGSIFFLSLLFSLPTFLAKAPFFFNIPFLSTAQPTRLLFITDFSLAILCALGFDYFLKRQREIIYPVGFLGMLFGCLWFFVFYGNKIVLLVSSEHIEIAKRNMIFPTGIYLVCAFLSFYLLLFSKRNQRITIVIYAVIVGITVFDLFRFAYKFTPFTNKEYLFPQTKTISFLQKNQDNFRIMTTDSQILPPNFSVMYRLQSIDGYDPLYLRRYGELIAASERGKADINPPFGFNRIITPHRYDSKIIDLLGVKYVLSLSDISSPKLTKVFQEGQTRVYENKNVFPRVFFVEKVKWVDNKQQAIEAMFDKNIDLRKTAIVEKRTFISGAQYPTNFSRGKAHIILYTPNKIIVETDNANDGFLVLTDSNYSTWKAKIYYDKNIWFFPEPVKDGNIPFVDFNFRGVFVDRGKNRVVFYNEILSDIFSNL